jgi:chorismate mutase
MARGPFWLCTELKILRQNMDKTDREIAELLPKRNERAVCDFRAKVGLYKRYPHAEHRRASADHAL